MSPDIQSFDLDKDPAVLALEEFTADGQAKIGRASCRERV